MNQKRLEYVDVAKAFGIILIVLGHVLKNGIFRQVIFSFHVPMFFFISGITFHAKKKVAAFLANKAKRILVPYFCFSIISICIYIIMGSIASNALGVAGNVSLLQCIWGMLYGNSRNGFMQWNQPLWFLPCLFSLYLIEEGVELVFVSKAKNPNTRRCIIGVLSIMLVCVYMVSFRNIILPFSLEQAIMMLPFFEAGMLFSAYSGGERLQYLYTERPWWLGVSSLIILVICTILSLKNGFSQVRTFNMGSNPIFFILCAILGTVGLLGLSVFARKSTTLCYIGQRSLQILLMHKFPVLFFQVLCPASKILLKDGNSLYGVLCSIICTALTIGICMVAGKIIYEVTPVLIGCDKK